MKDASGFKYFLSDHPSIAKHSGRRLGSTSAVLDANGGILEQQRYLPFGGARTVSGSPVIASTDLTYTGQRNLPDTGLMDYRARFYSTALGRFIQPDTIIPGMANPQSWNRYSYVQNRPINFNDPTGHMMWDGGSDGGGSRGGSSTLSTFIPPLSGGGGYPSIPTTTLPAADPCGGMVNCPAPIIEDEIQELIGLSHDEACQFFHLDPYMCDSSVWQSLPSSVSVPPFEPMPMYCGNISGLACAANLSQDIATLVDMTGLVIEVPAVAVGCFEGGPSECVNDLRQLDIRI